MMLAINHFFVKIQKTVIFQQINAKYPGNIHLYLLNHFIKNLLPASTRAWIWPWNLLQIFAMVSLRRRTITSVIWAMIGVPLLWEALFISPQKTLQKK
jgi:hypothetical protein